MSKVSIIIPTYNSGKTVRNALESVYRQSFQDWECIIVDGASKDNTLSIINEYVGKDARFRYISEKDNGIYDAFNKGWRMAKGKWIHYLGSDDTLTMDGMEKVASELDEKYAVVTGDVNLLRIDGTIKQQQAYGFIGCHQGVVMQRNIIEQMGGFDESYRIIADHDLMVRTENAGYNAKNVRSLLANFRVGGESQKISAQWKVMNERVRIYKTNGKPHPRMTAIKIFVGGTISRLYRKFLRIICKFN